MGCCINHFIGFEDAGVLDDVLSAVAQRAVEFGFEVHEFEITDAKKTLRIQPHQQCETLCFDFRQIGEWTKTEDHLYWGDEIKTANWDDWRAANPLRVFLTKDLWYSAGFTKTEYAPKSVHAKICELLRMIAPVATLFCIRDEAGFYGTRSRQRLLENHGYLAGEKVNDLGNEEVV